MYILGILAASLSHFGHKIFFVEKHHVLTIFFFTIVYIHVRDTGKGCGLQEAMMDKTVLLK